MESSRRSCLRRSSCSRVVRVNADSTTVERVRASRVVRSPNAAGSPSSPRLNSVGWADDAAQTTVLPARDSTHTAVRGCSPQRGEGQHSPYHHGRRCKERGHRGCKWRGTPSSPLPSGPGSRFTEPRFQASLSVAWNRLFVETRVKKCFLFFDSMIRIDNLEVFRTSLSRWTYVGPSSPLP